MSTFFVAICILTSVHAQAFGGNSGGGESSGIANTQQHRSEERFDILGWIRHNQSEVAAQNSKWGYSSKGGSSRVLSDVVLTYGQDSGTTTRNSSTVGKDFRSSGRIQYLLDNLFTSGTRTRSLNIDLGMEGFLSQTTAFQPDPSSAQQSHSYNETGGGLLLRPFGRSSQDTGLLAKVGYENLTEMGLWTNSASQISLYGTYLGAEAKLYLLPFIGLKGEYTTTLEQEIPALQGKWKMQKFTYGAYLEIYLVYLSVYLESQEMDLTPSNGSAPVKENYNGMGFTGTLYF